MYTRCPSCRAEISFEPPANMESLPDGYKHRIKCPSCGVTIGVKINKIDTMPVQAAPQYNQPAPYEPVYANDAPAVEKKAVTPKHSGVGRNVTMMIMALLFIGLSVVGYFIKDINALIGDPDSILNNLFGVALLDGVKAWDNLIAAPDNFIKLFVDTSGAVSLQSVLNGIVCILPMIVFTLSGINFIVAFISACGKKYGRAYNVISSLLIGICAIATLLIVAKNVQDAENLWQGFLGVFTGDNLVNSAAVLVFAALGVLQILLGLCFTKSLKRKQI